MSALRPKADSHTVCSARPLIATSGHADAALGRHITGTERWPCTHGATPRRAQRNKAARARCVHAPNRVRGRNLRTSGHRRGRGRHKGLWTKFEVKVMRVIRAITPNVCAPPAPCAPQPACYQPMAADGRRWSAAPVKMPLVLSKAINETPVPDTGPSGHHSTRCPFAWSATGLPPISGPALKLEFGAG